MTPDIVLPIILGILGVLGGTGYWGYRQSRREAPVRQRDADIAAAERSQQMALAVADDLREDVGRLRNELGEERTRVNTLSGRVEELSAQLSQQSQLLASVKDSFRTLSNWVDSILENWDTIRHNAEAPRKPTIRID